MNTEKPRLHKKKLPEKIITFTISMILVGFAYSMGLLHGQAIGRSPFQETIEKIRYFFKIKNIPHLIFLISLAINISFLLIFFWH